MFTIVWLPVATAMVGSMGEDRLQKVIYIGTLLVSSAIMVFINLLLRRSPDLWVPGLPPGPGRPRGRDRADGALRPGPARWHWSSPEPATTPMFVLFLTGPLQRVLSRRLQRGRVQAADA